MAIESTNYIFVNENASPAEIKARDIHFRQLLDAEIAADNETQKNEYTFVSKYIEAHRDGWEAEAACKGLQKYFFAPANESKKDREARVPNALIMCNQCVVVNECYDKAIANNERFGIWGGIDFEAIKQPKPRKKLGRNI